MLPVVWAAMQVHYRFDIEAIGTHTVNNGGGKPVKIQLAVVTPGYGANARVRPRCGVTSAQIIQKGVPQTKLMVFIPSRRCRQFLVGFRMADDVHEAERECPERFPPPDDK